MSQLTPGAIMDILDGKNPEAPRVQVLSVKKIQSANADPTKPDRYRLNLSDGTHRQPSAMLATQLNDFVTEGKLKPFAIIQMDRYICSPVQERKIVIVLNLTVIDDSITEELGNPKSIKAETASTAPAAAASPVTDQKPTAAHMAETTKSTAAPSNPYAAPPRQNAPPRGGVSSNANVKPISSISPYMNTWTICARITNVTQRTYRNAKGDGKILSMDLTDNEGGVGVCLHTQDGEIKATAFNQEAERLTALIEPGKVYVIRGGRIKQANKKFNRLHNDYEITFDHSTEITPAQDQGSAPTVLYNFVPISTLVDMDKTNAFADVIAVVVSVGDAASITSKRTGNEVTKRDVQIVDKSAMAIGCTLWGEEATSFDANPGDVIAMKSARLSDYNGCSLSISSYEVNSDRPEVHALRGWYDNEGKNQAVTKVGGMGAGGSRVERRVVVSQIKDENLGMSPEKADYFVCKGTVTFVRKTERMIYKACPSEQCNKRVMEDGIDEYRCEKCQRAFKDFKYRMIISVSVLDGTGQFWLSNFNETSEAILGKTAQEMGQLQESGDERTFDAMIHSVYFKQFMIKCRAKAEVYNDETRCKVSAISVSPVDPVQESKYLIEEIKKYAAAA